MGWEESVGSLENVIWKTLVSISKRYALIHPVALVPQHIARRKDFNNGILIKSKMFLIAVESDGALRLLFFYFILWRSFIKVDTS